MQRNSVRPGNRIVIPTEVEGPAVSPHPTHHSNLSNISPLVAGTDATEQCPTRQQNCHPDRSGGTCCFSPSHSPLQLEQHLSPCGRNRCNGTVSDPATELSSRPKWRDLLFLPIPLTTPT